MFTQCLLPELDELAAFQPGESVLDLGAGSGIIARRFAKRGAHVVGLDFSQAMLDEGRKRHEREKHEMTGSIEYDFIDLMDYDGMNEYMYDRRAKRGYQES
jgi:ubiquinone/menaquinone biosynthesis C-methylase UbiE